MITDGSGELSDETLRITSNSCCCCCEVLLYFLQMNTKAQSMMKTIKIIIRIPAFFFSILSVISFVLSLDGDLQNTAVAIHIM